MALASGSYIIFPHVGTVGSTLGVAAGAGNSTVLFPPTTDYQIWNIKQSSSDSYTFSHGGAYATNVGGKLFVLAQTKPTDWVIKQHSPGYSIEDRSGNAWVIEGQDWVQVEVGSPGSTNKAVLNLAPTVG